MGKCCSKSKPEDFRGHRKTTSRSKSLINKTAFVKLIKGEVTDSYKIIKKIGDGGFGIVKLALHNSSNTKRAIKIIPLSAQLNVSKIMEEVNILKSLDHPNIVKIFEVIQDPKALNIVMEYCSGGELFQKIQKSNSFTENMAANYMLDIVSAIKYCHDVHIVHRDLKPENILFESEDEEARLKIIDFGTSLHFEPKKKMRNFIGTAYYIAPEVIDKKYDEKCDVWSLGIILYIMLCGLPPFNSQVESEIYEKIKRLPVSFKAESWNTVSEEAKLLIQKMLRKDPITRISISEVLSDPWIQNRAHNRVPDRPIAELALKNLEKFASSTYLQRVTMNYIASQLVGNEEINELRKIFQQCDVNGDGKLSKEEIVDGCKEYAAVSELDVSKIMEQCDLDGNGFLDYTEFLTAALDWEKTLSGERLENAFKIFDKDGNGKISLSELVEVLKGSSLDKEDMMDMIKGADKNDDGEIDFMEFRQLMSFKTRDANRI
jgi:calcium-dependent protein kinase